MEDLLFQEFVNKATDKGLDDIIRCNAVQELAKTHDRRLYPLFLDIIRTGTGYVRDDTILSAGISQDSRFLFPLFNIFNSVSLVEREKVLMALGELKDPRSLEFLQQLITSDDEAIPQIASSAYSKVIKSIGAPFLYRFVNSEDTRKEAENSSGYIEVDDVNSLVNKKDIIFHRLNRDIPQTYVVLPNKKLRIGGFLHEHVEVASGNDVLTAGEIRFDEDTLEVIYINNRSNGYYPDSSSFRYVTESLRDTSLLKQTEFNEIFPRDGFTDQDLLRMFPFYRE